MNLSGLCSLVLAATIFLTSPLATAAEPLSSPWVEAHGARARLIAGQAQADSTGQARLFAGVEIQLEPGWKTYWRTPGDSGGLPPEFDWSRSRNVVAPKVLYPAPRRFKDAIGDTVGYSGAVVFPVEIRRENDSAPTVLHLSLLYGICREICIPAEAELTLTIPAETTVPSSSQITAALAAVPRLERRAEDPELVSREARLGAQPPKLVLEALFPDAADSADMFIEASNGAYVPLPVRTGGQGDKVRFEVGLSDALDELRGATLRITMVSDRGQSEATWVLQ